MGGSPAARWDPTPRPGAGLKKVSCKVTQHLANSVPKSIKTECEMFSQWYRRSFFAPFLVIFDAERPKVKSVFGLHRHARIACPTLHRSFFFGDFCHVLFEVCVGTACGMDSGWIWGRKYPPGVNIALKVTPIWRPNQLSFRVFLGLLAPSGPIWVPGGLRV